jgi:hypothetical protein
MSSIEKVCNFFGTCSRIRHTRETDTRDGMKVEADWRVRSMGSRSVSFRTGGMGAVMTGIPSCHRASLSSDIEAGFLSPGQVFMAW